MHCTDGSEEQNSTLYRSTARLHYSIALSVLGYTAKAAVIFSMGIQGAVAEQDAGPSERFHHVRARVIVGEVATVLLILTQQPALRQAGDVVDDIQDVVLEHAVLQHHRTLWKHFSLASLCYGSSEEEEEHAREYNQKLIHDTAVQHSTDYMSWTSLLSYLSFCSCFISHNHIINEGVRKFS